MSATHTLRAAFTKAETTYPGLTLDLVLSILKQGDLTVNMNESILRLQGTVSDSDGKINFIIYYPCFLLDLKLMIPLKYILKKKLSCRISSK